MFVAGINVFYCDDCAEIDAPDCVLRSEILFRCRSWTSCSEVIFAAELCVVQRNCGANSGAVLAAELAACGEPVLAAELGSPQRTSSRCRFLQ